jgi:hypothetical protein
MKQDFELPFVTSEHRQKGPYPEGDGGVAQAVLLAKFAHGSLNPAQVMAGQAREQVVLHLELEPAMQPVQLQTKKGLILNPKENQRRMRVKWGSRRVQDQESSGAPPGIGAHRATRKTDKGSRVTPQSNCCQKLLT